MVTTINKYTIRFDGSSDGGSSGIAAIPHLQIDKRIPHNSL